MIAVLVCYLRPVPSSRVELGSWNDDHHDIQELLDRRSVGWSEFGQHYRLQRCTAAHGFISRRRHKRRDDLKFRAFGLGGFVPRVRSTGLEMTPTSGTC